jgi:hypothetical protein
LQGLTNIGYQNCILSSRLGIHKELLLPFQIVSRSDFSSCIAFTTPSIPNYKSFQESWRVKASQVWPKLLKELQRFMTSKRYTMKI